MNVTDVVNGTKQYLYNLVNDLSERDFIFSITKPIINMAIENNFDKVENILNLISDKNNNIDVEKLIDDSIISLFNSKKADYPIGNIATINFGNDGIKINAFNKYIKFTSEDFIKFKNYLIDNYGH